MSHVSFTSGQTVADLMVVAVTNVTVDVDNGARDALDLVANVDGYYLSDHGSCLAAVSPGRVLDTRAVLGAARGSVSGGESCPSA